MAIYNEILAARFSKFAQKLFSMKGAQAIKQVSGELPVFQKLPFGVEHRFMLEEQRFGMYTGPITGAAAQFPAFRFRNLAGSKLLATIEKILLASTAANGFNFDLSPVSLDLTGAALVAERLDGRIGNRRTALTLTTQTTLAAVITPTILATNVSGINISVDAILFEDQEIPILPGDALTIGGTVAASTISASVFWRERALEETELS